MSDKKNIDMTRAKAVLLNRYGGCLSSEDFANLLNINLNELSHLTQTGKVFHAVDQQDRSVFPRWQVYNGTVLEGLNRVLAKLDDRSIWSKMIFFTTYNDCLEGALADRFNSNDITPIEALRRGYIDQVVEAAEI